mgnify:FL=1
MKAEQIKRINELSGKMLMNMKKIESSSRSIDNKKKIFAVALGRNLEENRMAEDAGDDSFYPRCKKCNQMHLKYDEFDLEIDEPELEHCSKCDAVIIPEKIRQVVFGAWYDKSEAFEITDEFIAEHVDLLKEVKLVQFDSVEEEENRQLLKKMIAELIYEH